MSEYNVDYTVVKKPGNDLPLTEEEAAEWVKCASDPMYFFTTYCWVVGPFGKTLFEPRDYQDELLEDVIDNRFVCVNAPRQTGKSTLMALLALHTAIFGEDQQIGITSYRLSGCKDLMSRVKFTYEALAFFLKPCVELYNQSEVKFTNGSAIFSQVTSDQTFRGRSINALAICDEFAFCAPAVAEEFYTSFMPALEAAGEDSQAKVVFISTPNSSTGKYAEIAFGAMEGNNGFIYHKVDPDKIPGRTEKFKADMKKKLGVNKYLQEYEGAWLADNSSLINSAVLESIKYKDPVRQFGDLSVYVDTFQGRKIAFACDVAEGVGKDNHAIQFLDIETLEQVAEYANNTMNQRHYFQTILKIVHLLYNEGAEEIYYTVENNGLGNGLVNLIQMCEDPIFTSYAMIINDVNDHGIPTGKTGMCTTNKKKMAGCTLLKELVEEGKIKLNSASLLNELRMFTKHGQTFKAEPGAKDDRVMAMVILMNVLKELVNYEEGMFNVVNEASIVGLTGLDDDADWGIIF